jgi:hypothetical protein
MTVTVRVAVPTVGTGPVSVPMSGPVPVAGTVSVTRTMPVPAT